MKMVIEERVEDAIKDSAPRINLLPLYHLPSLILLTLTILIIILILNTITLIITITIANYTFVSIRRQSIIAEHEL